MNTAGIASALRQLADAIEADAGPTTGPAEDLSLAAVALAFGRSESAVRAWVANGKLRAYRAGRGYRVTRAALDEFRSSTGRAA